MRLLFHCVSLAGSFAAALRQPYSHTELKKKKELNLQKNTTAFAYFYCTTECIQTRNRVLHYLATSIHSAISYAVDMRGMCAVV